MSNNNVIVVGIDPALANVGMVKALVDGKQRKILAILDMQLVKTTKTKQKGVIQNHDRLRRGREILQEMRAFCCGALFSCAEIPEGAQDASAAWALGTTIGILCGVSIPMIEVRPRDVKLFTGQGASASKEQMRQWAYNRYPDAPWLTYRGKRTNENEHLADAIAILELGLLDDRCKGYLGAWTAAELLAMPFDDTAKQRRRLTNERRRLKP